MTEFVRWVARARTLSLKWQDSYCRYSLLEAQAQHHWRHPASPSVGGKRCGASQLSIEALRLTIKLEIDQMCDAFENSSRGGKLASIEEYLRSTTEPERTELFRRLLLLELYMRRRSGECPALDEYLSRFPSYSGLIRTEFVTSTGIAEPSIQPSTLAYPREAQDDREGTKPWSDPVEGSQGPVGRSQRPAQQTVPSQIGRYVVERLLGEGNFSVYLAFDPERGCHVAIKVARPDNPGCAGRIMSLAIEAKRLGTLEHPCFVKVYEYVPPSGEQDTLGRDGFLVLEYIEGQSLERLFKDNPPSPGRLAEILAQVADSLQHAHEAGVFHRDVKPANILVEPRGNPRVCDFGLAVDEEAQTERLPHVAGTIPYMAPEQVRGEVHRIDGRTDVWALGVILYEGLTRKLPFPGRNSAEYFEEILHRDPKPPRMIESRVPRELQRICLCCLSRRMSDRYLTAGDLAADLRVWEAVEFKDTPAAPIVSKGLSCYDVEDATFFQALLPGPRGNDGLAEAVRFWKARIESTESSKSFSVGLLYGPSGGGKSSFVKAGLLPHLDHSRVHAIYLEATPQGTEDRLLAELRSWATGLRHDSDLPGAIALLRDVPAVRRAPKLFVVIDQFEQWLQAQPAETISELVRPCVSVTESMSRRLSWFGTTSGCRSRGSFGRSRFHLLNRSTRQQWNFSTPDTPAKFSRS
jgi:serine/threonine protein kinase